MYVVVFLANIFQQVGAKNSDGLCGCSGCNKKVLTTMAGDHTCGDRIKHLIKDLAFEEHDACKRVAVNEFPDQCGSCACGQDKLEKKPDFYCGCKSCTPDVWATMTEDYTCGARISYAHDILGMASPSACKLVATQFPDDCGTCDPTKCGVVPDKEEEPVDVTINGQRCGCMECDDTIWNTDAESFTCGERISWLVRNEKARYPSVKAACLQVAANEFGQCSGCNPAKCDGNTMNNDEIAYILPAMSQPETSGDGYTETTLTARTPLYCFPDFAERTRWRNVWGKYTVEVKESDELCGPSDNKFTSNTVSLVDNNQLKLQFKKVGNAWEAGEVRVRLPEAQMPFLYGRYSFSIESVQVIDTQSGAVIDDKLPPTLILGLFTWDDTEDYASSENFNHEVDIEISRWNKPGNEDLQFLVRLCSSAAL